MINVPNDMGKEESDLPTLKEYYHMLREQIQHEDNLVNQRITWLLAIEGFLFVALAAIITGRDKTDRIEFYTLFVAIAGIGALSSWVSKQSIGAAHKSLKILRNRWNKQPEKESDSKGDLRKSYPPITYVGKKSKTAWSAAYGIPNLIQIVWIGLVIILFSKPLLISIVPSLGLPMSVIATPTPMGSIPTPALTPLQVSAQTDPTLLPIWIQAVGIIVTIIVGALGILWQVRRQWLTHSATLISSLEEQFRSPEMLQARKQIVQAIEGKQVLTGYWPVLSFFDGLGAMVRRGAIDEELVWNRFGWRIARCYIALIADTNLLKKTREVSSEVSLYEQFEWLGKRMKKRYTSKGKLLEVDKVIEEYITQELAL